MGWFHRGVAVIGLTVLLAACGRIPVEQSVEPLQSPSASVPTAAVSSETTTCEYVETGIAARPVQLPGSTEVPTSGTVRYLLEMTNGPVQITLDRVKAPCTVHSFESLADQGFFTKTQCPRLVDKTFFILQCGDPTGTGTGGPGYTFADETDGTESYVSGVVAMATSGPNTNGSQFFLVWDDSTSLNDTANATIFGRMDAKSRDVIASMAAEGQDGSNPHGGGRPNNPSEILSATRQ